MDFNCRSNATTFSRIIHQVNLQKSNRLRQLIGLAKADNIALLEIHWPTSGTTQVFRDVAVDQAIAITEFADDYQHLDWKPIPVPKSDPSSKMTAVHK